MIALGVIIPLVLYFVLARWLFDKYYRGTNENLRKWLRRGVLSLPFLDIIIGFIIFGFLCLFSGGTHIYQTVDDVEAQKAYWFKEEFLFWFGKDQYSEKQIEIENLDVPLYVAGLRNSRELRDEEPVKLIGYINYCKSKYDTLQVSDSNYRLSCVYTDKIIEQYNIQNIIKPPENPYYYKYGETEELLSLPFYQFLRSQDKVINTETGEVLAVSNAYIAGGGWFFMLLHHFTQSFLYLGHTNSGAIGGECCLYPGIVFQESVIPNPYKQP